MEEKDHSSMQDQQGEDDENFPIGLKVLALDANIVCLKYLVLLLRKCQYKVTATTEADEAIRLLKDEKEAFDIVITDVIRFDMDGFKLLNVINDHGMDIPVVMVSANDELDMVKRGVMEGAEAYLLKPVRLPEVRNIWQHVLRKRISKKSNFNFMAQIEDRKPNKQENIESDETKNQDDQNINVGASSCSEKKPRMKWTKERHAKFLQIYDQLQENERVPKIILKYMNEPQLSRANIASHLQKHRDGLRKKKYYSSVNYQRNNASKFSSSAYLRLRPQIRTSGQCQYPPLASEYPPSGSSGSYFPVPQFKWFNFPSYNSSTIANPCDQFLGFGSNNVNQFGGDCLNYSTPQTLRYCPIDNVGAVPQLAAPITSWQFPDNTSTGQCSQMQFDKGSSYGGLKDDDVSDILAQIETFLAN